MFVGFWTKEQFKTYIGMLFVAHIQSVQALDT